MSNEAIPPKTGTADQTSDYKTWQCGVCGFVYSERDGWPDDGIPAGTRWQDIPEDWACPDCGASKNDFEMTEI